MEKQLKLMSWPVKLPSSMFTGWLMINHPPVEGAYELGFGEPQKEWDVKMMEDIIAFYEADTYDVNSEIWGGIIKNHGDFIEFMRKRDYTNMFNYLRYMFTNPLMHGVAQGDFFYNRLIGNDENIVNNTGFAIYDKFITLMESTGLVPMFAPEDYQKEPKNFLKYYTVDPDKYIQILEQHYGIELKAPAYQGGHFGIQTAGHGLYSDRDIMSLAVAIRIAERYWEVRDTITICDIGGGVGHLAYYLTKFGFKNITTIDVPTVAAASIYFLDTNLPGNTIIKAMPGYFFGSIFDLVINVDGLTGYGVTEAKKYVDHIATNAKHFYSVNKESDSVRVCDVAGSLRRVTRNPCWLRRGYVEEDYVR
jgi:hypothetical protein